MPARDERNEPSVSSIYRVGTEVLFSIFGDNTFETGSNTPIVLNDPDSIYLVHKGIVDIFVVRMLSEQITSPRTHLFRVKEGQAMLGLDTTRYGDRMALIAVGVSGTVLSQIPRIEFEEALRSPLTGKAIGNLLDGWIRNFSRSMNQELTQRQVLPLEAGKEIALKEGEISRPKRDVLWVSVLTGMVQFVSREELPLMTGGDFLPVCDKTWIRAHRESKLRVLTTSAFITAGFTWDSLLQFHEIVLNSILWNIETAEDIERERLLRRGTQDKQRINLALEDLSQILDGEHEDTFRHVDVDETALVQACQIVGNAIGAAVRPNTDRIDGKKEEQTLETIIRNSGLRIRQVMLRDDWWRQDNGALLAFMAEDKRPIALTPTSPSRYLIHDPTYRRRERLTTANAQKIAPAAYLIYRTLPTQALSRNMLMRFGFRGAYRDLVTIAIMGIVGGVLALAVPLVMGRIFDTIVPGADRSQLLEFTLLLVAVAVTSALFQVVQNIAVLRTEIRVDSALQSAIWDRLLNLPAPFFRAYTAGDLTTRAMGISTIRRRISGTVIQSVLTSVFSLFSFVLLFYFDTRLAIVASILVIAAIMISIVAGYYKMQHERRLATIEGYISGMVLQFIGGVSKFRVAGVENRAFAQWAKAFAEQKKIAFQAETVENWLNVFNTIYPVLATMVIFALVVSSRTVTTGEFLAFNAAFMQFLMASLALSNALISGLEIVPAYERMRPILQNQPEVDETKSDPGALTGAIEVSRLSFRYKDDSPLILGDVSILINPGEFVAIVGPSGSGKSTLFRLLLGFEKPESGGIFYDGQDLANLDITAVRQQLGVVLQNGQLMTGDIFSNIVGVAPLTLDDAWHAAEMAGLKADIEQMPMGMHTIISEGGSTFSGGQRQRLLIARAIARKPRILFFDEATSALDNQTQAQVSASLESLDATRVVIAHRLSTIVNADNILVLDKGQVVQQGKYADLIRQQGVFRDLAMRQLI